MKFELTAGAYKSIEAPFTWDDIPQFAILTGENGVGKTQLLQVMYRHIFPNELKALRQEFPGLTASFSDPSFDSTDVLFLDNFSQIPGSPTVGLNQITRDTKHVFSLLRTNKVESNPFENKRIFRLKSEFEKSGIVINELDEDTFFKNIPKGFFFRDPKELYRDVAQHFFNYYIETFIMRAKHVTEEKIVQKLGPPPWDTLNELFDKSLLRYKIKTPEGLDLRAEYKMTAVDVETDEEINIQNLSSGEAALIRLYLWLFIANNKFSFPKLVLLDEPDSHLEPALIHDFIQGLKSGLVDELGVRVIMSTHRMETVTFAPPESVYEMYTRPARVEKSRDRGKTISLLTQNLITIVGDQRPVFVEDEDDAKFYSVAFGLYVGEKKNTQLKQLVFLPVSIGKGKGRDSGGSAKVIQWVERLYSAGLFSMISGIIDRDDEPKTNVGVLVLHRYSIENYLLDPLVIYAVLLDNKQQPTLELTSELKIGEEYKIKELSSEDMQKIATHITSELAPRLTPSITPAEETLFKIEYTHDKNINVPQWLIDRKGHELMAAAYGKWPVVKHQSLLKALEKVRLLPEELRILLDKVLG